MGISVFCRQKEHLLLPHHSKTFLTMKHTATHLALSLALVAFVLGSCKKKETTVPEETAPVTTTAGGTTSGGTTTGGTTGSNPVNTLQTLFSNLATPMQSYVVNAGNYHTFVCANGTKIILSPNAFIDQAGAVVSGMVNIDVKDVLSKKDMVLNNAFPVSNNQLLVSGGEVYFNPTQNGQSLRINPAGSVRFLVPAGNSPSYQMQEFYARPAASANTSLNWLQATNTATNGTIGVMQDTTGQGGGPSYYYNFNSDSVFWANCDYFYNLPGAKTTCSVSITGNADNSNTMVFLSKDGSTTIFARLYSSYNTISQLFMSYANAVPVGSSYTIGAISFDGTNYYYASQQVTMTANMAITLPALVQTTKAQIEINLSNLP